MAVSKYTPTEKVFIKGKLSWVKVKAPNDWGKWTVTVHPDQASLEIIRDLQAEGLKNVLKKDDEGYYVAFSRPTQKLIKGKVIGMAPPVVVDDKGEPLDKNIGNGSDGIVKLEVYAHGTPGGGRAKAARLESIKVMNLVPYEPERDMNEDAKSKLEGMDKQEMFF